MVQVNAVAIAVALIITASPALADQAGPKRRPAVPEFLTPRQLDAMFDDKDSVEDYLDKGRTPDRLFNAAGYYFLNLVDVLSELSKRKGPRKLILNDTIEMLEQAVKAEPDNHIYRAFLGDAYGLKITFSGFPALLFWAKKCQTELNRAVRRSKGNPEVRLLRLRSMVHFPYQYYPELKEQNVADARAVLAWIEEVAAAGRKDPAMRKLYNSYMRDIRNEVYTILGQYFKDEAKEYQSALNYLKKVEADCFHYCDMAKKLLDDLK